MFEWNIEELKLMNNNNSRNVCFPCERTVSREDKITFVDKMQDGKLSYILALQEKFKQDKPNLPKDKWGGVKTVSLKAWLNKNDDRHLSDTSFHYGKIRICDTTINIQSDNMSGFWIYDNLIDETFHRQLCECARQEEIYFKTHDEYEILKTTLKEKIDKLHTTFGVKIITSSNGSMSVGEFNNCRPITIEEIKELLVRYEMLEQVITELTNETHIE